MFDVHLANVIMALVSGISVGPFLAGYSKYRSEMIHNRDLLDIAEAKANGSDYMELPEGTDLFKNKYITFIITSLLSGLLWAIMCITNGFNYIFLINSIVSSVLVIISIIDFQVYEIPVEINCFILFMGVLKLIINLDNWLLYIIGFAAVSILFLIIALVTKGMGGGDIKLMATLGLVLGWKQIILVMILGCILGAVIHGLRIILFKGSRVLAFGPYLSMAAIISMCYGDKLIEWYMSLFAFN